MPSHYDLLLHAVAVRNTAKWSEPVFPRGPDQRGDWDILLDLAQRLEDKLPSRLRLGLVRRMGLERTLDVILRTGPYGDRFLPFKDGLNLDKLRRAVHGIDFGPLVPMRKRRVFTPSGLVELAPRPLVADVERVEQWLQAPQNGSLVLIGRRHLRSNNSWMHNAHSRCRTVSVMPMWPPRCESPARSRGRTRTQSPTIRSSNRSPAIVSRAERDSHDTCNGEPIHRYPSRGLHPRLQGHLLVGMVVGALERASRPFV